jgi:hypothetical protein
MLIKSSSYSLSVNLHEFAKLFRAIAKRNLEFDFAKERGGDATSTRNAAGTLRLQRTRRGRRVYEMIYFGSEYKQ